MEIKNLLDWSDVHEFLESYRDTTPSLRKEMVRTIEAHKAEIRFVVAYYEKEILNRMAWQLMDFIPTDSKIEDQDLVNFCPSKKVHFQGNTQRKYQENRLEYEKLIIQEILKSGLDFKNIQKEFEYNFFEYLIEIDCVSLAIRFPNSDFIYCLDKMRAKKVYDFQYIRENLKMYKNIIKQNDTILTEYDYKILMFFQTKVYVSLMPLIEEGHFNFFPLLSSKELKKLLVKDRSPDAFHILVKRHVSAYGHVHQDENSTEEILLDQLFDLWENGKISNYSHCGFKVSSAAFYSFVNKNKLIAPKIFRFFCFFRPLVPYGFINGIDPVLFEDSKMLLNRMSRLQLPFGTFEVMEVNREDPEKDEISCVSDTKKVLTTETWLPKIIHFSSVYNALRDKFIPFRYTYPIALEIYKKLNINAEKFIKVVAFGNGRCIEAYRQINENLGFKIHVPEKNNSDQDSDSSEIYESSYSDDSFYFMNLNIKYACVFERRKSFANMIVIEQSLPYHPPEILQKLVCFSTNLGYKIFLYLKEHSFEVLQHIAHDFLAETYILLSHADKKLFRILRKEKIEVEDVKPYLVHDLDLTFYTPQELISLFEKKWSDDICRRCANEKQTVIDYNLKRVLSKYTEPTQRLEVFKYFCYKNVENRIEFITEDDTLIFEYLYKKMIADKCPASYHTLRENNKIDSDLQIFYKSGLKLPIFCKMFFDKLRKDNTTLKQAVVGYSFIEYFKETEYENFSDYSQANIFFRCIFSDCYALFEEPHDDIFETELFQILSQIRPKDLHPFIPGLSVLNPELLELHLKDQYFSFVHRQEIEEMIDTYSKHDLLMKSDDINHFYAQRIEIFLKVVENIKICQLISLFYHQSGIISQLAQKRLKSLQLKNPDVVQIQTKIFNFLVDNSRKTSASFLNDITFYHNLDKKSIEMLIQVVKKSKDPRLVDCIIRISKHSHLNFYLINLLSVSDNVLYVVDELRYVIDKQSVLQWARNKLNEKIGGMSAVYIHKDIVEILYIMNIDVDQVLDQELQIETQAESTDLSQTFYISQSIIDFYKILNNHESHTLFYLSTYASKLSSFEKYIPKILPIAFSEFLSDNSISFIILKNMLKYTDRFDIFFLKFIWMHLGSLTVSNKLELVVCLEIIYNKIYNPEINQKKIYESSQDVCPDLKYEIISYMMILIIIHRLDHNSNVQKEFSKFFGTIHGTKIVKAHMAGIFRILDKTEPHTDGYAESEEVFISNVNNSQLSRTIDDILLKYSTEVKDLINSTTSNKILLKCLENKFMTEDVMKIVIGQKRKIIDSLDESTIGDFVVKNTVDHSIYELFSDDLIIKKIFSGDLSLLKYLKCKSLLYHKFLEIFVEIKSKDQSNAVTNLKNSDYFRMYQEIKENLLKEVVSDEIIEKYLTELEMTYLINDYVLIVPQISDFGQLRNLLELTLRDKSTANDRLLQIIVDKVDISILKLMQDVPLDLIVDFLDISDLNIVRNRLDEIKECDKWFAWLLRAYLHLESRNVVQFCIQKLLKSAQEQTEMSQIIQSYCSTILSERKLKNQL